MTADEKSVIFQEKFGFHKKKDFTRRRKIKYIIKETGYEMDI